MITKFQRFSIKLIDYDEKIKNIISNSQAIKYVLKFLPLENITFELINYDKYLKNIEYLVNMSNQKLFCRNKKYSILSIQNKEFFITEFLFAKQLGYIKNYQGHLDLDLCFYKLLPFLENYLYIILQNSDDKRISYGFNLDNKRTLLIVTEQNIILSIFIQNNKNLHKQIKNKRFEVINQFGGTTNPLTLNCPASSCPKTFWRQTDLLDKLYQKLKNNSISQNDFINLVDIILYSKEKIKKYKKYLDKLSPIEKIEILEEIESLEKAIQDNKEKIDKLVYKIYNLSDKEIKIIKGKR